MTFSRSFIIFFSYSFNADFLHFIIDININKLRISNNNFIEEVVIDFYKDFFNIDKIVKV